MALNLDEAYAANTLLLFLAGHKVGDGAATVLNAIRTLADGVDAKLRDRLQGRVTAAWVDEQQAALLKVLARSHGMTVDAFVAS